MDAIPDYNSVPESFYTDSWWKKPDPFPMTRKRSLRDLEDQEVSLLMVRNETFVGREAGAPVDPEDDHESQYGELGLEYDMSKEGTEL